MVTKSARGELEITSVIDSYLKNKLLSIRELEENTAWMDCGTVDSMNDASNFIRQVEQSSGKKVGCIEEIAWRYNWIDNEALISISNYYGNNEYGRYIRNLLGD